MAIYRKINTTFWSDPFICDLPADKKLFYLYLLTNERTKQCGIYDISKRQISFDLGLDNKTASDNITFFQKCGKIMFSESTNEIAIKNWDRFNGSTSPKVVKCVESELKLVKNRVLIEYIYSTDTLSQQTQEETQTEEEEETKDKRFNFIKSLSDFGFEKVLIADWIKVRKAKRLTNSETAFNEIVKEFEKCERENNILRNDALKTAITNSWGGFKSDWIKKEIKPTQKPNNGITLASPIL